MGTTKKRLGFGQPKPSETMKETLKQNPVKTLIDDAIALKKESRNKKRQNNMSNRKQPYKCPHCGKNITQEFINKCMQKYNKNFIPIKPDRTCGLGRRLLVGIRYKFYKFKKKGAKSASLTLVLRITKSLCEHMCMADKDRWYVAYHKNNPFCIYLTTVSGNEDGYKIGRYCSTINTYALKFEWTICEIPKGLLKQKTQFVASFEKVKDGFYIQLLTSKWLKAEKLVSHKSQKSELMLGDKE